MCFIVLYNHVKNEKNRVILEKSKKKTQFLDTLSPIIPE